MEKVKKAKSGIFIILLLLVIAEVFLSRQYDIKVAHLFQIERNNYNSTNLKWSDKLNLKQSLNACASYSSMAYIYSETGNVVDPEMINKEITGKLDDNTTYPWGITRYLKRYNISSNIYWHGLMSDISREKWIKTKISNNKPVIIMTGNNEYRHFITILGFRNNTFNIYNSLLDTDKNGDEPGNISIHKNEVLRKWKKAKFKGIPVNIAISI